MRKRIICILVFILSSVLLQAYIQSEPDEKLFQEAKILIFDEQWKEAQEKLEEILRNTPAVLCIPRPFSTRQNVLRSKGEKRSKP